MNAWEDDGNTEDLKKVILGILVGKALLIVGIVGVGIAISVYNFILGALNKTGFAIPSSANYLNPIGSLPSTVFLMLMIVFIVVDVVVIIWALPKTFSNLGT